MKNNIHRIIKKFYHGKYSGSLLVRFAFWFRLDDTPKEKEESMRELWEESPSVITGQTLDDLNRMHQRIGHISGPRLHTSLPRWVKYAAAAILLVAVSSAVTYYSSLPDRERIRTAEYTEFIVPHGESQELILPDSSVVWLNAGSILVYPKEFISSSRTIYLSGEAHFDVAGQTGKPFVVKTKDMEVEALGTVFNVRAYPGSDHTTATLEEGSIQVRVPRDSLSRILVPNEQFQYSRLSHEYAVMNVDARKLASWKEGYLIFQDASFEELVSALERKYNVQINYNADKYSGQSYYVRFNPDESLEDALSILSHLIHGLRYNIKQSTVSIF